MWWGCKRVQSGWGQRLLRLQRSKAVSDHKFWVTHNSVNKRDWKIKSALDVVLWFCLVDCLPKTFFTFLVKFSMHQIVCIYWRTASRGGVTRQKQKGKWGDSGLCFKDRYFLKFCWVVKKCRKLSLHEGTAQWSMLLFGQLPSAVFSILHVSYYWQMKKFSCAIHFKAELRKVKDNVSPSTLLRYIWQIK